MEGLKLCIVTIILTGLYLILSVSVTSVLFKDKSNGSLIKINSKLQGSRLIGQEFKSPEHFHGRPSTNNYQNNISGNSNLPYGSKELKEYLIKRSNLFKETNKNTGTLNIISESASGLDPHITYESALKQVKRVSSNLKKDENEIIALLNKNSKPRIGGILGERIVNVVEVNIEIDELRNKNAKETRAR